MQEGVSEARKEFMKTIRAYEQVNQTICVCESAKPDLLTAVTDMFEHLLQQNVWS